MKVLDLILTDVESVLSNARGGQDFGLKAALRRCIDISKQLAALIQCCAAASKYGTVSGAIQPTLMPVITQSEIEILSQELQDWRNLVSGILIKSSHRASRCLTLSPPPFFVLGFCIVYNL